MRRFGPLWKTDIIRFVAIGAGRCKRERPVNLVDVGRHAMDYDLLAGTRTFRRRKKNAFLYIDRQTAGFEGKRHAVGGLQQDTQSFPNGRERDRRVNVKANGVTRFLRAGFALGSQAIPALQSTAVRLERQFPFVDQSEAL